MAEGQLGVGIMGAGRVSRDHAYAATAGAHTRLVAIADPVEERVAGLAERFGCDAHTSHREMLSRPDVDLVLAGVPHGLHGPLALDVLNGGKHLMIEKPMAIALEECDAIASAAASNGRRLMVGHTQHFFPANLAVKGLIESGRIGAPVMASQWWYKPFGLAGRPAWMLDRSQGGGMWMMNGAHMLDLLMWLIDSDVVAVKGRVTNSVMGQRADDSVVAYVEFACGVGATVNHSGAKRPEPPPPQQWMTTEVVGTEGSAKVVSYQGEAYLNLDGEYEAIDVARDQERDQAVAAFINAESGNPPGAPLAQSVIEQTGGIAAEVAAFAGSILRQEEPPVAVDHATGVMRTLLAIEESSASGREIRLAVEPT